MVPGFEDLIQSHQFTFFVGHEGKPIVVHAAAIAATSPQLDALINGGMKESETRCVRLEDIRVDDFIRFCEYAYRGDYTVPPWQEVPLNQSCIPAANERTRDEDDMMIGETTGKKKKGKKWRTAAPIWDEAELATASEAIAEPEATAEEQKLPELQFETRILSRTPLRAQFDTRNYLQDGGSKAMILHQFEPKPNSSVNQNFTPVLLAHARLYCFAALRLIAPLKALTLDKLHKTLMGFKLYTQRVGDIIELARYAYSNQDMPSRNSDGTVDDLRKLIIEYIVCEIDIIGKCDEFVQYMEDGGEFVGDFWRMSRDYMA